MVDIPGNNTTTVTLGINGVAKSSDIASAGDHDWFKVTLTAGQTYVFGTNPTATGAVSDTFLTLRNSAGTSVADNDNRVAGDDLYSAITYTAPSSGTYYLDVSGVGGATGDYLASAARIPAGDIADNNLTTETLQMGSTRGGSIEVGNDQDWFIVTLTAGQRYTFMLEPGASTPLQDSVLLMLDSTGNLVVLNDDYDFSSGDTYSSITFTPTTSGIYYLIATGFDAGQTGDYYLSGYERENLPTFTLDQIANQMVNDFWTWAGGSARRFNAGPGDHITVDITGLTTVQGQALAVEAFNLWSDITGFIFDYVSSGALITVVDTDPDAFSFSTTSGGFITSSTVNIGIDVLVNDGITLDSYAFQTFLHEFGHALGLGHAGNYNFDLIWGVDETYLNDAWTNSVMSYFNQFENTTFQAMGFDKAYTVTPMLADIVAISQMYGLATNTRTGNTTYGFNNTSGRDVYDASLFQDIGYTVFDNGGIDTLDYSGFGQNQLIDLNQEAFSNIGGLTGNVSIARGTVIENAIGGSGDDVITGNSSANTIDGGLGADTIDGRAGPDTINGGGGNDIINGYTGNDTIDGGANNDDITGSGGNDTILGGGGNDTINSGTGNDFVDGGPGADDLSGAGGSDEVHGGGGNDTISAGQGPDTVYGDGNDDTIHGNDSSDTIYGGSGNDTIFGDLHQDTIYGESGDDHIYGGNAKDTSTGGTGADTFHYNVNDFAGLRGGSADRITDFSQAEGDLIDMSVIDAAIGPGQTGNQAFTFIGASAFGGNPGELHYVQEGGNTYVEGDRNGDMVADFALRLDGLIALQAADFIL